MAHPVEVCMDCGPLTKQHPKSGPQIPDTRLCLVYWGHRHHKEALTVPPCSLTTLIASRTSVILRGRHSKNKPPLPWHGIKRKQRKETMGHCDHRQGWWTQRYLEPIPCSVITLLWHYQGSALPQCCSHTASSNAGLVLLYMVTSWLELSDPTAAKMSLRAKGELSIFSDYGNRASEAPEIKQRQFLNLQLPALQN